MLPLWGFLIPRPFEHDLYPEQNRSRLRAPRGGVGSREDFAAGDALLKTCWPAQGAVRSHLSLPGRPAPHPQLLLTGQG